MNTIDIGHGEQREVLANRLVSDLVASMETLGVWLGLRLGLYAALDRAGASTATELASNAGIDARYAREWLEQQAVAGVLVTTDAGQDAGHRRYELPGPHREVLLDEVSPYFAGPVSYALAGVAEVLPELLTAYRTGAGVPYAAYGDEIRDHIEQLNRPMFVNDLDEESILRAKRNATEAGVAGRVNFAVCDAADPPLAGRYDAVMMFEALHDLARPVEVLAAVRALLVDGGCMIVGDERVAETFTAPGDEVERLLYGFSILHCLPAGQPDRDPVGGHRHRAAPRHPARLCHRGRFHPGRRVARGERHVALLPAGALIMGTAIHLEDGWGAARTSGRWPCATSSTCWSGSRPTSRPR